VNVIFTILSHTTIPKGPGPAPDRPAEDGLDPFTLTDLSRNGIRHPLVGRAAHVTQRFPNAIVRKDVEERRLFQLDRESLLERSVKGGVARRVDEVGDGSP